MRGGNFEHRYAHHNLGGSLRSGSISRAAPIENAIGAALKVVINIIFQNNIYYYFENIILGFGHNFRCSIPNILFSMNSQRLRCSVMQKVVHKKSK